MSEERFDRIEAALNKLTILHEETRDQVKLIAEGFGATNGRLDAIDDRLETLLTKHDTRITALEKRRPARR